MSPTTASRLERAKELIAQGRVSQNSRQPTTYFVSALDNRHAYIVQLTGPNLCSCPDSFYRRIYCKHYLAAAFMHIGKLAAHEEQAVRKSSKPLRRAGPRPGRPIWYEERMTCADCGSAMPPTDPCPRCRRLICDKCFDGANGVCLACPIEGGV